MKIAILGAESTGKTTLAQVLAERFDAVLVPEYARKYVDELQEAIKMADVYKIAQHQILEYNEVAANSKAVYVFDTTLLTSIVWLEDKYSVFDEDLFNTWKNQNFDLILLCLPDLPWEFDPQRSDEHRRFELHEKYQILLKKSNKKFAVIDGFDHKRNQKAFKKVAKLLGKN
ncbi:MAG TPA: AAA family ATPase [Saprospiraceae bacterium]|nr:AAA family ATPase [Saprospiraceae bacterium]HOY11817.1 AAA family ATPase [Saprospiraceae bacterium]HPN68023.1 AAA family ATPase [Saprospiraceae bacterium]